MSGDFRDPSHWPHKQTLQTSLPNAEIAQGELGIIRIFAAKTALGWNVSVSRQGKRIARKFQDGTYGGWKEALDEAIAYRDAILSALPPMTYDEIRPLVHHKSRNLGIQREDGPKPRWRARAHVNGKREVRSFSVGRFGERGAQLRAKVALAEMLAKNSNRFHTHTTRSDEIAEELFSERLDQTKLTRIPTVQVERLITTIDEQFDARRPQWIRVTVRPVGKWRVAAYVAHQAYPSRVATKAFRCKENSLQDLMLGPIPDFIQATLSNWLDRTTACDFLAIYGDRLIDDYKDTDGGVSIRVRLPLEA